MVVALGRVPGLRLDRTGAAVVGAAAMVVGGIVGPGEAWRLVDGDTLVLLFGMMVVVGQLRLAGVLRLVGVRVARHAGTPRALLAGLVASAGLLSALFVNDTVCVALTPLVLGIAAQLRVRATPYLMALATASNIGSVATPTGNPQNMLIAVASGIAYRDFVVSLLPLALLGLLVDYLVLAVVYRREMAVPFPEVPHPRVRVHRALAAKALGVSAAMLAAFLAGVALPLVALAGAAVLLVTRRVKPEKTLAQVDFGLLTMFAGLFVVTGAMRASGLTAELFAWTHAAFVAGSVRGLVAVTAVLSNLVSNVPAVMVLLPVVPTVADPARAYRVLAAASTLAGNLTLVGSVANLIVAEGARRTSPLGFREYLRAGIPVTLLTLLLTVALFR